MPNLNLNASLIQTTGLFHNKVNNKNKTHLPQKIKKFTNNIEVPKSQDYVVKIRGENHQSVNFRAPQWNGKSLTLKDVCLGFLVVQTVAAVAGALPVEGTSDIPPQRDKRGISLFAISNDCSPYAKKRAKAQALKDCSDDIANMNRMAKHLIHHARTRGRDECNNINNEIKEMKIVTGKPVSTGVSSECLGGNISNDIANLKTEKMDTESFIKIVEKQNTAYSAISGEILRMHGNNVDSDIRKLEDQQEKIWSVNEGIHHLPDNCKNFIKDQDSAENTRGAYENLEALVAGHKDTNFEINRALIFANDEIPKRGGMDCEVSPIAERYMDAFHNERFFRCDNGGPKDKYCDDAATQRADKIYNDNFSNPRVRAPLYFK
ncbi:hypothetical protein [Pantoea phytobeneficialis]|uniref:Uncharacterized protein n=1 Tax=Pantoea phytobeneficialis TaxID=2052056 RepID=A0AAP9KRU1_9GAMM|nr:hypothetical protein [Pantoea phytobeneficialis]MDO6407476.1 hypothetical protein [Pantoea phytobeneficialis]QGR09476.1 hypothetical protein CTZ24_23675 [Pantoea phytobeneficialis]